MDFDYQTMKDAEFHQRENLLSSQPAQHPTPMPRQSTVAESHLTSRKPPIKPRRSIKVRPTTHDDAGQSSSPANQQENEVVVKRIAPTQLLGPNGPLEAQTPSLRAHILLWFQTTQLPRLYKQASLLPSWLHGFATRREAEQLLQDKQQGCFLLRLSESKVGFVLSYRGADRCRHFIIEEELRVSGTNSQYLIAGEQSRHDSLEELIDYYTHNPVGPFNETLTIPCEQGISSCEEEEAKLGAADDTGTTAAKPQKREAGAERLATGSAHDAEDAAQYAMVRKALRKTRSLPECKNSAKLAFPVKDNDVQEPIVDGPSLGIADSTQPVEAPYARVNKPPRAAQITQQNPSINATEHDSQRAAATGAPLSFAGAANSAEQKYWELEPMHTYEETLHVCTGEEEIDFYAVSRRRELAGDLSHHLYSEVNIKGTRDDLMPIQARPPVSGVSYNSSSLLSRPKPTLPQRPAVRSVHASSQPENSVQSFGRAAGMTAPALSSLNHSELSASSTDSIYEQIPARPSNSRPPLPPENSKR